MQDMVETNTKKRVFELDNGNKLIAIQSDPYGFWRLHLEHGQLPERFQGDYSYWDAVVKDVERYKVLRTQATETVVSERPVLRTKIVKGN